MNMKISQKQKKLNKMKKKKIYLFFSCVYYDPKTIFIKETKKNFKKLFSSLIFFLIGTTFFYTYIPNLYLKDFKKEAKLFREKA